MRNHFSSFLATLIAIYSGGFVMAATIHMTIDQQSYPVTLEENDAAKDFVNRLPMTVVFEDFGRYERIAYLKTPLNLGQAPTSMTPESGDITYYIPWNNIAVFTNPFRASENLVPLGALPKEALEAIKRSSNKPVHFSAQY